MSLVLYHGYSFNVFDAGKHVSHTPNLVCCVQFGLVHFYAAFLHPLEEACWDCLVYTRAARADSAVAGVVVSSYRNPAWSVNCLVDTFSIIISASGKTGRSGLKVEREVEGE